MRVSGVLFMLLMFGLGCGDVGRDETVSIPSGNRGPITFAVFGNTGQVTDDGTALGSLIDQANNAGVDFLIDLGNSLPVGVPSDGVGVFWDTVDNLRDSIDAPVYPVAGPDDVFDYGSDVAYAGRYGPLWYGFTRGGIRFLVLSTEDEAYAHRFGNNPRIGDQQLSWLMDELAALSDDTPAVFVMNRPLWDDSPAFWNSQILPLIETSPVALVVSCAPGGLMDWGESPGVRAVTTGCTGPTEETSPGLFPHLLMVSMNSDKLLFSTLLPDGDVIEGIPVDRAFSHDIGRLADALTIPPIETGADWSVNATVDLTLENPFDTVLEGSFEFDIWPSTEWDIRPRADIFTIAPGERRTMHVQMTGETPELGPLPQYHAMLGTAGTRFVSFDRQLALAPPSQRDSERIVVRVQVPELIPYAFDGGTVSVPVDIGSIDTCGRLIIYREEAGEPPECLHISPLIDFNMGLNTFTWNGNGLDGEPAPAGDIVFYVFAYNKEAPCTWIADGPSLPGGSLTIERTLSGQELRTHTDTALVRYSVNDAPGPPRAETVVDVADVLDGLPLTGYARDDDGRLYLGTRQGIVRAVVRNGIAEPDRSFAVGGYLRFTGYRGRTAGTPLYANGRLITGIGGGGGAGPAILLHDSESGRLLTEIDLTPYYGDSSEPPAINADSGSITCAHPASGMVLRFSTGGGLIWLNDRGDRRIGATDSDGMSHTYGIGTDQYGFSYVCAPGTSARSGVLGPDGRGLFRVILVQLPGLRTSRAVPVIEEADTDGLYLVTEGGDRPYTYHIPFTIRRGRIVQTDETFPENE